VNTKSPRRGNDFHDIERLRALRQKLLEGDENALEPFAGRALETLPRLLRRSFPRVPADWATDAVVDAILELAARPDRVDPTDAPALDRFLLLAARRTLINLLRADSRRRLREARYAEQSAHNQRCSQPPEARRTLLRFPRQAVPRIMRSRYPQSSEPRADCIRWIGRASEAARRGLPPSGRQVVGPKERPTSCYSLGP
jgi:DNA-directed RNA polymerase specialized sigma24 family protein